MSSVVNQFAFVKDSDVPPRFLTVDVQKGTQNDHPSVAHKSVNFATNCRQNNGFRYQPLHKQWISFSVASTMLCFPDDLRHVTVKYIGFVIFRGRVIVSVLTFRVSYSNNTFVFALCL